MILIGQVRKMIRPKEILPMKCTKEAKIQNDKWNVILTIMFH